VLDVVDHECRFRPTRYASRACSISFVLSREVPRGASCDVVTIPIPPIRCRDEVHHCCLPDNVLLAAQRASAHERVVAMRAHVNIRKIDDTWTPKILEGR